MIFRRVFYSVFVKHHVVYAIAHIDWFMYKFTSYDNIYQQKLLCISGKAEKSPRVQAIAM